MIIHEMCIILKLTLLHNPIRFCNERVSLNINEMFEDALRVTRVEMTLSERQQFVAKHLKTMQMHIDASGNIVLDFKR